MGRQRRLLLNVGLVVWRGSELDAAFENALGNAAREAALREIVRDLDGVADCLRRGRAVTDDADAVEAEDGRFP